MYWEYWYGLNQACLFVPDLATAYWNKCAYLAYCTLNTGIHRKAETQIGGSFPTGVLRGSLEGGQAELSPSVQFSLVSQSCPTLCDPMDHSTPGLPVHHQLPEFTQIQVHWVSDAIQPSHPLSSPSLPTFKLSQHQGLYKWVSSAHQVAEVWSFSFSICPSNKYSGFISFRIDWFDLFAVQRTLKSLLWHHSLKVSILQHSAFFMVQLSHPYIITRKTIALTIRPLLAK